MSSCIIVGCVRYAHYTSSLVDLFESVKNCFYMFYAELKSAVEEMLTNHLLLSTNNKLKS